MRHDMNDMRQNLPTEDSSELRSGGSRAAFLQNEGIGSIENNSVVRSCSLLVTALPGETGIVGHPRIEDDNLSDSTMPVTSHSSDESQGVDGIEVNASDTSPEVLNYAESAELASQENYGLKIENWRILLDF